MFLGFGSDFLGNYGEKCDCLAIDGIFWINSLIVVYARILIDRIV